MKKDRSGRKFLGKLLNEVPFYICDVYIDDGVSIVKFSHIATPKKLQADNVGKAYVACRCGRRFIPQATLDGAYQPGGIIAQDPFSRMETNSWFTSRKPTWAEVREKMKNE